MVIYKYDGTINTGYTPNWRSLSSVEKKKVMKKRNDHVAKLVYGKGCKTRNGMDNFK